MLKFTKRAKNSCIFASEDLSNPYEDYYILRTEHFTNMKFLAAGVAGQIEKSVLVFSLLFSFSNLYPYCQSKVSFGYLDFQGTSP